MGGSHGKRMLGALIAGSMLFSSTGAIASVTPVPAQIDSWAALSALSGGASAAAVCGAAAAAAVAAQAAPGCVLPQVDVAAPVAQTEPAQPIPMPPIESASAGLGISPLLIGLAAVAAGVGLYFALRNNGNNHHGNSPA